MGVLLSYLFVGAILLVSNQLSRTGRITPRVARKFIHIGVCHWWFIAFTCIDSLGWALVGPLSFILINFFIARFNLIPGMNSGPARYDSNGRYDSSGRNYGTVYFPITLVILVLAVYRTEMTAATAGMGVMIMGWGDGMASLIGEHWGSSAISIWGNRKSAAGTGAMFLFSFIAVLIGLLLFGGGGLGTALLIAAIATFFEVFTPWGLDNITVPLASSLALHYLAVLL